MPVTWNLTYPTRTEEQSLRYRHHLQTLSRDSHVTEVTAEERSDTPYLATLRVTFGEGYDRPDSQELRFADVLFPNSANVERHISVPPQDLTTEQAQELLRQLSVTMNDVIGVPAVQAVERFREAMMAIRVPDISGLFRAIGQPTPGHTLPPAIPKWIQVGCSYSAKVPGMGAPPFYRMGDIVTLKKVHYLPDDVRLEVTTLDMRVWVHSLTDFVHTFELCGPQSTKKTAWDKVLENSPFDDD
jgi:hypothetical protein